MKTFIIQTLGCKVNQYESQQIREFLELSGLSAAADGSPADLILVNTCCVTHVASAKSRQSIRKLRRDHPAAPLVVAGCLPAGAAHELREIEKKQTADSNTFFIVRDKQNLPLELHNILSKQGLTCPKSGLSSLNTYKGQARAFLKIQDGCDGYCTYCIIPSIRTQIINKPLDEILQEAHNLVYAGHNEIVLTGIFLGAWGRSTVRRKRWDDQNPDLLAGLIEKIAQIPDLKRLRLSSLEPGDVTDRLLDVMAAHANIMPHLHLPLQSGSPDILRRMGRRYTLDEFHKSIEMINIKLDHPAVTTDIIVGFPGETDADFDRTLAAAQQFAFSKIHVFSYSDRAGTPAAKMTPKVAPEVIKSRSARLNRLDKKLQRQFRQQFIGREVEIVVEEISPPAGRCERYFLVEAPDSPEARPGQILRSTITK